MDDRKGLYQGREQTEVKHFVLQHYLRRFAHIIGFHWDSITYVDGFSGPWNSQSEEFSDSSFFLALKELRGARDTHRSKLGKNLRLRCFFVEKDPKSFAKLKQFTDRIEDADVSILNQRFEDSVEQIRQFIASDEETFPFIFIDPTGWTGFAMRSMVPILERKPSEVLINFMTGHIIRFIEEEASREGFEALFGSPDFKQRVKGLSGNDRIDAIVEEYCGCLKGAAGFRYVCPAIVIHPLRNRAHYHLIYATRDAKGVEVFKDVEKQAMSAMEKARAKVEKRRREEHGQRDLFAAQEMPESKYYISLRNHYLAMSEARVLRLLNTHRRVPYDCAWETALCSPMVWESDLKAWIKDWRRQGSLNIEGLSERERVAKRGKSHALVWGEGSNA